MEKLLSYVDYCKGEIEDGLNELANYETEVDLSDLGDTITESMNVNGSATFSTYKAKQYIKEWFEEAGMCYEYEQNNFGEVLHNPFEEPEAFHVCMIIHGVNVLLNESKTIQDLENDPESGNYVTVTQELADKIISEINEIREINL